jgi:stage II sporulation protein AA (anti-sigma F factor antagonist)
MKPFSVSERAIDGGVRLLSVTGLLDLSVADRLEWAIEESADDTIIDLMDCEFIDSVGVGVILSAHRRFAEMGKRLVVCRPQQQVSRVLSVTGLFERGLAFPTLEEAIGGGPEEED